MRQNLCKMPGFTAAVSLEKSGTAYIGHPLQIRADAHVIQAARRVYCYVSSREGVVCIVY